MYTQSNLKFSNHCSNILLKKGYYNIRNVFNTFRGHNNDFYEDMYKTYVRPILEPSCQVWSPHLIGNIDKVDSVQGYFTRKLSGLSHLSYSDLLSLL